MEFLINDLSFHGQFADLPSFKVAIGRIMAIRRIAQSFGRELYCHRAIIQAQVTTTATIPVAVQSLMPDERRALMQWLTRYGPFWEDVRNHGPDDWLEWNGGLMTETALGEAAWCCLNGIDCGLVSIAPSDWEFSPVSVDWVVDTGARRSVDVANHWDPTTFQEFLQILPSPLDSWDNTKMMALAKYNQLTFVEGVFDPLNGYPFSPSGARRLLFILEILNRFKSCFDEDGQRTPEGHQIYRDFFTGKKGDGGHGSLFCDSSDNEKMRFKKEMTFRHPTDAGATLFCTYHGRVQTPQLRVHYSWPVRAHEPLYVVYVGPKITK